MSTISGDFASHPEPPFLFPGTIPPLEHGDRLSRAEFELRWEHMPDLKKAELLDGVVYLPSGLSIKEVETVDSSIPPLENGDNLDAQEFERRYNNMPNLKKAELLRGSVYMGSPVTMRYHCEPDGWLATWTGVYRAYTPGVEGGGNGTVKLPSGDWPQPDQLLRLSRGGASTIDSEGYVCGPPEMAIEISATTANKDLNVKKEVYATNGVREYLVWRVYDGAIDWFHLKHGQYIAQSPDSTGLIKSEVFPGLWLDVAAMLRHDMPTVLARLQDGLASDEHKAFVARLSQAR